MDKQGPEPGGGPGVDRDHSADDGADNNADDGARDGDEAEAAAALGAGEASLAAGRHQEAEGQLRGALALATAPLLRARVMDATVRLCIDGGDDLAAEHWLEACEGLRMEHAGPDSPEVGRCWLLRARLFALTGADPRKATGAWERAVRLLHGAERVAALRGLGEAQLEEDSLAPAERSLLQAEAAARSLADPQLISTILPSLARLRSAQGQHERAVALMHEEVALVHDLHGPGSMEAANILLLLAGLCEAAGDLESAVSAMQRAVATLQTVIGPDDPETAMAAAWLLALHARLEGAPPVPD